MNKILPPILFVLFAIGMGLICWKTGSPHNIPYPYNFLGLPFILGGIALAGAGKRLFKKLDTNVMTFDEPGILVTEGVFKYTRNPMYLGFAVSMLGFALLLGAAISSFLLAGLFILITDRWYIAFEEKQMSRKFGDSYKKYCSEVRRWF